MPNRNDAEFFLGPIFGFAGDDDWVAFKSRLVPMSSIPVSRFDAAVLKGDLHPVVCDAALHTAELAVLRVRHGYVCRLYRLSIVVYGRVDFNARAKVLECADGKCQEKEEEVSPQAAKEQSNHLSHSSPTFGSGFSNIGSSIADIFKDIS